MRGERGTSVGAPGEPAGLEWLSVHYARKSLADDAAPAEALARNGVVVGRHLSALIGFVQGRVRGTPLENDLLPGGHPLAYRSTWRRPALAATLARFGAEGARPFYTGDIAGKIVAAARAEGSVIDLADPGGSGGRRIAAEVTQATLARLIFGFDPGECVSAPRMYTDGSNLVVDREVSEDTRAALRLRGETVSQERFARHGRADDRVGPLGPDDPRPRRERPAQARLRGGALRLSDPSRPRARAPRCAARPCRSRARSRRPRAA